MMPDGFSFQDLKPAEHEGFSIEDVLKPAKKPTAKDDGLPWDVPYTGAQMRAAREQIRLGEEKIRINEPEPGLEHLLTGPLRIAQRGGQQLLGERPLPTGVEALEEAGLGVRPSKFTSAARPAVEAAPRVEPTMPGGPRPALPAPEGFTLEQAGITPTPEPPAAPGAIGTVDLGAGPVGEAPRPPLAAAPPEPGQTGLVTEVGIQPTPEALPPAAAAETETVAVPQADGTVRQVQVRTREPPPPSEPPSPPESPIAGGMTPADLRAGFPDLTDEQFEALFQQANREVPRPTTTDPADQAAWMKSIMGIMARLGVPGAVPAPAGDPWAPVAVAPIGQPEAETEIPQAAPAAEQLAPGAAPEAEKSAPEAAPSAQEPVAEPTPAAPIEAHGGPWAPVLDKDGQPQKNYLGDQVYENPQGVRAIMDNGVPWTEATKEVEGKLVPKNAGNRKRQHLTADEPWEAPKSKTESVGKTGGKAGETKPAPPQKAELESQPQKPGETEDWKYLYDNEDGDPVYANPQGVHSVVKGGVRIVESVRMRPTREGMQMSVPPVEEKESAFRPAAEPDKKPRIVTPKTEKDEPKQPTVSAAGVTPDMTPEPSAEALHSEIISRMKGDKTLAAHLSNADEDPDNALLTLKRAYAKHGVDFLQDLMSRGAAAPWAPFFSETGNRPIDRAVLEEVLGRKLPKPRAEPEEAGKTRGGSTILKPKGKRQPKAEAAPTGHPSSHDWSQMLAGIEKDEGHAAASDVFRGLVRANNLTPEQTGNLISYTRAATGNPEWSPSAPAPAEAPKAEEAAPAPEPVPTSQEARIARVLASSADQITPKDMVLENLDQGGQISGVIAPDGRLYVFHQRPGAKYDYETSHRDFQQDFPEHDFAEVSVYNGNQVGIRSQVPFTEAQTRTINGIRSHAERNEGKVFVDAGPFTEELKQSAQTPEEAFAAADAAYKAHFPIYQQAKKDHLDGKISDDEYFAVYGEHQRLRDAVDAAQEALPDEYDLVEQRRVKAGVEQVALDQAYVMAEDPALETQMDDIRDMLKNGWTPGDIAVQPGIDRTPREIRALHHMWREEGQLLWAAPDIGQAELPLPLTQKEKYDAIYPADTPAATGKSTTELKPGAEAPTLEADGTEPAGPRAGGLGQPEGGGVRAPRPGSRSGGRGGRGQGLASPPAGNVPVAEKPGDIGEAGVRPAPTVPGVDEPVPAGGDAPDGRPGAGGQGVDDAGTGGGPGGVGGRDLDLGEPGEIQEPTLTGRDVEVPAETRPNFFISDPETMVGGGPKQRFNRNRRAIEALRDIQEEGRPPTEEELATMSGFTGWGSFGQDLFQGTFETPVPRKGWDTEGQWLREHLGPEKWRAAQASIRNAHYTDPPTVQAMWNMVQQMGFKGGRILEPSMGVGNFFGLMPRDIMGRSTLTGIELDPTTGGMAQLLYPQAGVFIKGYQESQTPDNFYDLVIGNWPFDAVGPADRRYNRLNPTLHDYFYLKALDQTRPGGLVVGITSAGTMDKMDRLARMEMAKKGELIASFRLPTGAFEQYAGTAVVTDIIVLRKRAEPLQDPANEPWVNTAEMRTPSGQMIRVNHYYHDNPQNILGTIDFGHGTTTARPGMIVHRPTDLMERLQFLPGKLPVDAYAPITRGNEPRFITNNTADRKNSVVVGEDGNLYQVAGERLIRLDDAYKPLKSGSAKAQKQRTDQIKELVAMRKAYGALIDAERDNPVAAPLLRETLQDLYGRYVRAHKGPLVETAGMKVLDRVGDPNWPILAALQRPDGTSAAIMSGPVVRGRRVSANPSISDAYVMTRNESTTVNPERIAELTSRPVDEVEQYLLDAGAIYRTPGGGFEASDGYLSGNTRRKLREAEEAVARGEPMESSVEALRQVIPPNTPYYQIEAKLGAPWVSNRDYQQFFAQHLLDLPEDRWPEVEVTFSGGKWSVSLPDSINRSIEATQTHGHPRYRFDRLLTAAMGNTSPRIMDPRDSNGGPYYNPQATEEVATRIQEVREKFQDWAWADAERTVRLEDAFNNSMNAITKPRFDGSFMDMAGMALTRGDDPFDLRRHQINAIWRGISHGRGLFAHEVGTGKTYTIGGIAIEGRRYGKWNKPLLLAHNANSKAVAAEIQQMYPGAKILYLDSENLTPATLKASMYQVRNEDWDLVVMQHSHLDRLALKRETLMGLAREQITAVEDELYAAAAEDNVDLSKVNLNDKADIEKKIRSVTAKSLAQQRLSILTNIEKQAQRSSKEGAVPFEDLGVDAIFVDEAHEFKKPPIATRMKVKGLNTQTSARSIALNFLTSYIKNNNNGNGVFLFTGTPVTNSLNEIFNMARYFMDDTMKREGVGDWDTWFNTFADALNDVELVDTGDYESVKRLSSFVNVDELVRMMSQFTDVVLAQDMPEFVDRATPEEGNRASQTLSSPDLTEEERDFLENGRTENPIGRPYKRVINDVVEIPPDQAVILAELRQRALDYKQASPQFRRENRHIPLVIGTEVGNASIDARLYDPEAVDNPSSKVNRATKNVLEIYKTPKTSQMIFVDKGYNPGKRNPNFNMINDLIDKLVKGGIPRNEIAVVAGDLKPAKKKAIAEAMNDGRIRVAIGQSGTLGVGVNAQDNLRAMHHMDAPWRPGDLEQRNGRGHRQGNSWNTVLEYRYITEGIDGRRWQVLTIKDKFIKQFINAFNDESGKRIGVIEGDAADISDKEDIMSTLSAAAGDPRLMQKEKLKSDVTRLERRERTHRLGVADAAARARSMIENVRAIERAIATAHKPVETWEAAQARMEAAAEEAGAKVRWYEANIEGQELRTSAEIQDALDKAVLQLAQGEGEVRIGSINGLGIVADWRRNQSEPYYHLIDANNDTVGDTMTGLTVQRIVGQITKQRNYAEALPSRRVAATEDIAKLEKAAQQPFTQGQALLKKRQQLAQLEDDLQENPIPPPAWLRHGAPIDTSIWVDGQERIVRGHRMKDDYYIVTDEGDVPYMRVTDKNGFNVYTQRPPPPAPPPKDLPAWAPPLIAKTPGAQVIWHRGDLVLVRAEQDGEEVFLGYKKGLTDDQQAWNVYGMRGAFDVKDIDKLRSEASSWRDRERNRKALEEAQQPKPEPPAAPPSETPWMGLGGVDPATRRMLEERAAQEAARLRALAEKWIRRQTPGRP